MRKLVKTLFYLIIIFGDNYSYTANNCSSFLNRKPYPSETLQDTSMIDFFISYISKLSQPRVGFTNAAARTRFSFTSDAEGAYRHFNSIISDAIAKLDIVEQLRVGNANERLLSADDLRLTLSIDGQTVNQIRFIGIHTRTEKPKYYKSDNPLISQRQFAEMLLNSLSNGRLVNFMNERLRINGFVLTNLHQPQGFTGDILVLPLKNNAQTAALDYLIIKYSKISDSNGHVIHYRVDYARYLESPDLVELQSYLASEIL
jgi:hypothetical protein